MPKNAVTKTLDDAVCEAFHFHLEASAPLASPVSVRVHEAENNFVNTLSPAQLEAYQALSQDIVEREVECFEHYYRLGFIDGLSAWRGA